MEHGNLHSLIPLSGFKAILGFDDREDVLSRYCLITATYTIEEYCKRRLLRKKRFEFLPFYGDYIFSLRDYPVRDILAVYQTHALEEAIIVEPDLYHTIPDCGEIENIPFCLSVSPALRLVRELSGLKVHYRAGYAPGKVPPDLASACLELADWNMNRYRGRRIGMTGNIREKKTTEATAALPASSPPVFPATDSVAPHPRLPSSLHPQGETPRARHLFAQGRQQQLPVK
ncbi:MAG: hypothetical protein LBF78_11130 [Treponema sp.]|jgi:hypothetical protein|nr:hypothetical protein [Treponema sp.]